MSDFQKSRLWRIKFEKFWKMRSWYVIWTNKRSSYDSGQRKQTFQKLIIAVDSVFWLHSHIESDFQRVRFGGKSSKTTKMSDFPLNAHSRSIFFSLFTTLTFGRTIKAVMPRPIQSFAPFQNGSDHFLTERSSPPGWTKFYFLRDGGKFDALTENQS